MLCIAVHAGWNAAACLAPTASSHDPARMGASALLGGLALAGALRLDTADGRVGTVS